MNTQASQAPQSSQPIKPADVSDAVAALIKDQPIMGQANEKKPAPTNNNANQAPDREAATENDQDEEVLESNDSDPAGAENSEPAAPDAGSDGNDSAPLTLSALAEKLGVEAAELYGVEISLGGDQVATLGELKDSFKQYNKAVKEYGELTLAKQTHRNEVAETISTLSRVASMLPPQARTPEFMEGVRQYAKQVEAIENKKLLGVFPEWADPKTYHAARDAVLEAIKPYGLTSYDLGTILDSRWVRFLHDSAELRGKFAKANLFGKQVKKPGQTHGASKNTKPVSKQSNIKGTRLDQQVGQVAGLLNNL